MNYLYLAPPLVSFAFCLVLIFTVLRFSSRSHPRQVFIVYLISMAIWGLVLFGMRYSPDVEHALIWDRAVMGISAVMVLLLYHFTVAYTGIVIRSWLLPIAYISFALIIALSPTSLLIPEMQVKPYGYAPVPGIVFPIALLIQYIWGVLAIINLALAYRRTERYVQKNRYLYILIGILIMSLGAAFDFLPLLGLPIYPGSIIASIIFCVLVTIAIVKYNLLDIRIIIRKGSAYVLMSVLTAIPYGVAIITVNHFLAEKVERFATYFILMVLGIIFLQPVWHGMQRLVDSWYYYGRYNQLNTLQQLMNRTHSLEELLSFAVSITNLIRDVFQASHSYLLILTPSGYKDTAKRPGGQIMTVLGSNNPLVTWCEKNGGLLRSDDFAKIPQLQALTGQQRRELEALEGQLYAPVKTAHNKLVGLIVVGEKESHRSYTLEEEEIIMSVASRLSVNLENAYLYAEERSLREQVERQNEEKTEFLRGVAHELKTPLTAILSSSELLGMNSSDHTDIKRRISRNIQESAFSMNKRVSELLDMAKLQIGELSIKLEPLDINRTITEIQQQLQVLFQNKKQTIELEVSKSLPRVNGDREKLGQVLSNVLSNANKYSPVGSKIVLRVREQNTQVVIEVEDSGPTINEAEKTKIFDPYYRTGDTKRRAEIPGLGLGLAISKKIVELHKGEIWVGSKPTKGNIFVVSLPAFY
ncbi:ATP-binding protein [Chloroflexota bacterium]